MQYKVRYRPMERLSRQGWSRLSEAEQDHLIAVATELNRRPAQPIDGSTKDGMPGVQEQYRVS
jgi:arginine-tRNA-protein transferase